MGNRRELIRELEATVEELRAEIVLLKSQLRVEGAVQEIGIDSILNVEVSNPSFVDVGATLGKYQTADDLAECPDCSTRYDTKDFKICPLCWKDT